MKKIFLSIGAVSMALAMFVTGCASTSQKSAYVSEVEKIEAVVANARGLENHTPQPGKYLLPNVALTQTKVVYINWAGFATDAIPLRFGEADVVSVARDAMDTSHLKAWDALRNAGADKAKADAAEADLKKVVAESYAKNKTTSKLSNDEMYNTVVNKIAQEDYVVYESQLKSGEVKESDFKDQKDWLEKGKAKLSDYKKEEAKILDAVQKRTKLAEKEAEDARHKVELTIKYYTLMGTKILANSGYQIACAQAQAQTNPFIKKGMDTANEKAKDELKKLEESMNTIKKEFPDVVNVFDMSKITPLIRIASDDLKTALSTLNASDIEKATKSAKAAQDAVFEELKPWGYSADIAAKRIGATVEVKKWAGIAEDTKNAVEGK